MVYRSHVIAFINGCIVKQQLNQHDLTKMGQVEKIHFQKVNMNLFLQHPKKKKD